MKKFIAAVLYILLIIGIATFWGSLIYFAINHFTKTELTFMESWACGLVFWEFLSGVRQHIVVFKGVVKALERRQEL